VGLGASLLLLCGCDVRVAPEERLVFQYAEGIQSLHEPTYQNFYLACHPDAPFRSLSDRLASYEEARKKPTIEFSPDGIEIIRLGALGRGAYFRVRDAQEKGDRLEFKTLLQPDYLSINFTEFPARAVLYILGEPLGSVIRLKPGKITGPERVVLQSLDLSWSWKRLSPGTPVEWCLESVVPLPASAEFQKLKFSEESADSGPSAP
jgi:hypothetical protein